MSRTCNCRRSDAWRCAVDQGSSSVACSCACHRYLDRSAPRPAVEILKPERYLEIGLTPDEREIIINFAASPEDSAHHVIFSPAQALNLAKLLTRKAEECKR